MSKTKIVNEKNTKKEILEVYEELVNQLSSDVKVGDKKVKLPNLTDSLEIIEKGLKVQTVDLKDQIDNTIAEVMEKLQRLMQTIQLLLKTQSDLENANKEEEERVKKEREREKEEYEYDFNKRKKRQEEELRLIRENAENKLKEQRDQLLAQENEFKQLKIQVEQFDQTLKKAVETAVLQTTKDIELRHKQETVLLKQQYESNEKLLSQKIELLQITISSQTKEIERLQLEVVGVQNHLTKIAERAVEKPTTRVYAPSKGRDEE